MTANELIRHLRRLARKNKVELIIETARGSHLDVIYDGRRTTISMHPGDIPTGTLKGILKQLNVKGTDL